MELKKLEVSVVEDAVALSAEAQIRELCDLQLAVVGGGIGETIL